MEQPQNASVHATSYRNTPLKLTVLFKDNYQIALRKLPSNRYQ